jgi:transposase
MRKPAMNGSPAAVKERAVTRAGEADQPMAQTARDLGLHDTTLPPWLGKDHRAARQTPPVHAEHLDDALPRLHPETTRVPEARDIFQTAAADCAHPLPCRTRGSESRARRVPSVVSVGYLPAPACGRAARASRPRPSVGRQQLATAPGATRAGAEDGPQGHRWAQRRRGELLSDPKACAH